jgi:2-furoyl-CoA dehydrogenase large subunit
LHQLLKETLMSPETSQPERPDATLTTFSTEGQRIFDLRAQYMADLEPVPNLHHAAVLRSPHAHARLRAIDVSAALAVPGVVGVLTGQDVARWCRPFAVSAEHAGHYYPCAIDKVRYVGEPVAVVVATDRYVAEDGRDRVGVEYEPLPAVVDAEAAMAPAAPILHEEQETNIAINRPLEYGDVDAAFAAADIVLSQRYEFPRYQSFPLETYGVIAAWPRSEEQVTLWSNFHGPYSMLVVLAGALQMPVSKLRVITPADVGGSFGNKIAIYPYLALMALASRQTGVPVKWVEDRLESLSASSRGTDRVTYIDVAATGQGEILAMKMRLIDNVGAYIRAPEPGCLFRPIGDYVNAYRFKNLRVEALAVMSNTCPTGPNRGYGCQQHYFPMERSIDELAIKLGKDPAEIRLLNLIRPEEMPYHTPTGGVYDSGDYPAVLRRALELSDYDRLRLTTGAAASADATTWKGVGLAVGVDPSGSNMGYMDVSKRPAERRPGLGRAGSMQSTRMYLDATGGVTVELDTAAHGQGQETTAVELVARELGIAPADVSVVGGMDTSTKPWTVSSGSYSSRFGSLGASSILAAVRQLKQHLVEVAAYFLNVERDSVVFQQGQAVSTANPAHMLGLRDIARRLHWSAGALPPALQMASRVEGVFVAEDLDYPNELDQVNSSAVYSFTADVAVVEIDKETLDIRITQYVSVHDAGNILHPHIVRGQLSGALLHGIAGAMYEEMQYTETGALQTGTLMDYLCPTMGEIPEETVLDHMIIPTPKTLSGAKGVGESTAQTAPLAIAAAVADALGHLGVKITALPVTPSRLWALLSMARAHTS